MASYTETNYQCDKCHKKLKHESDLDICTSLSEDGFWERLHVRIINHSGVHNSGKEVPADLCKACTIKVLTDALTRVKRGERVSAGVNDVSQRGW